MISVPTKLDSMAGIYIKSVALGSEHSIAVTGYISMFSHWKRYYSNLGTNLTFFII